MKNSLLEQLKEFLSTEEGQDETRRFFEDLRNEKETNESHVYAFHQLYGNDPVKYGDLLDRIIEKYSSDKYKEKWYSKGVEVYLNINNSNKISVTSNADLSKKQKDYFKNIFVSFHSMDTSGYRLTCCEKIAEIFNTGTDCTSGLMAIVRNNEERKAKLFIK